MSDRPILFSAPMVRALLAGEKTQTRRALKSPQPLDIIPKQFPPESGKWLALTERGETPEQNHGGFIRCRYGVPGDRLWVRESFSYWHGCCSADVGGPVHYWADGNPEDGDWTRPKPSIHLPRWASRLTLDITDVRVERLQKISRKDAKAEGFLPGANGLESWGSQSYGNAQLAFEACWRDLNGAESWNVNPWVWVIEFRPAPTPSTQGESNG